MVKVPYITERGRLVRTSHVLADPFRFNPQLIDRLLDLKCYLPKDCDLTEKKED